MATSGSVNYTLNRDQIITAALRKLRVIDPRLSVDSQDITDGAQALNLMIKSWQLDGVFLWLNEEIVLHLAYNTQSYNLGPTGDHAALTSDAGYTQLAAAASSGDSSLTVDSITGVADGDYIGIQLDDGTIQWSTVDGTPSGTTVALDDNLTDDAAIDNYIFHHTSYISRPLRIIEARRRDTDDEDITVRAMESRTEFMSQTDKTSTGETIDVYYEPLITNGKLYTWPVAAASDITDRLVMTIQRVIEDFDASANNFDGPVECIQALIYGLAVELAPEYGVDLNVGKGATILRQAGRYYDMVKRHYSPRDPIYLRP